MRRHSIGGSKLCGKSSWKDNYAYAYITQIATKTFADIEVSSTLNQDSLDESFGIRGVTFSEQLEYSSDSCFACKCKKCDGQVKTNTYVCASGNKPTISLIFFIACIMFNML